MADGYNGWSNWATWNVGLWIDNEEWLYRAKMRLVRLKGSRLTAQDVENFAKENMPEGTPDFEGEGGVKNYEDVDWQELADSWIEEDDSEDEDEASE